MLAVAGVVGISAIGTGSGDASHAATPDELAGFEYVALGDSYSAGFGLIPYSDTSPFPGSPNGCFQGLQNYPHQVAAQFGLNITDQTCSGAISANVGYPAGTTFSIPLAAAPLPVLPAGAELQHTMTGMTAPELQIAALSETTDIVTIAIGGNDLGFSSIATACVRTAVGAGTVPLYLYMEQSIDVPNCADYFGDPATYPNADLASRMSGAVAPRIAGAVAAVKELAPNAQVFVVGYPQVSSPTATDACFTPTSDDNAVPFSGVDLQFINSIEILLDGALQDAAEEYGFHYVPTFAATADHNLCSPEPWVWGLTAYINLSSSCDPGYLPVADGWGCVKLGALHPNEDGVAALAELTSAAISEAFYVTPAEASVPAGETSTVSGGGYYPGETVRVELVVGSTVHVIGSAVAGDDGSFTATVTVPRSIPTGQHTVRGVGEESDHSFAADLEITEAPPLPLPPVKPMLANTGFDGMPVLLFAGVLMLGGSALAARAVRVRSRGARG